MKIFLNSEFGTDRTTNQICHLQEWQMDDIKIPCVLFPHIEVDDCKLSLTTVFTTHVQNMCA